VKRSRFLLLAGTVLPTLVVGGAGYWLVARTSPDAAFSRVWLDVGLAVFLGALVTGLTQGPGQQVQRVVDMLRGISIGQRDRRLEPERFGDLEEVARACNEIAAALSEHEDPNLGHVQRRRRTPDEAAQKAELDESLGSGEQPQLGVGRDDVDAEHEPGWRRQQLAELSEHPDVGPVRVRKKSGADDEEGEEADDEEGAEPASTPPEPEAAAASVKPALHDAPTVSPADASPASAATEVGDADPVDDTNVDAPPAALDDGGLDDGGGATVPDTPAVAEPTSTPPAAANDDEDDEDEDEGEDEGEDDVDDDEDEDEDEDEDGPLADPLEALFDAYVSAKQEHGEPTDDLELTSFVATIRDESERLRESHQCRDVRFEVRVQDGAVSLLPRLLR
jgi:hypothetical protein